MMTKERYFYSEGYVYQGTDTICRVFGTLEQQKKVGESISRSLNIQVDINTPRDYSDKWKPKFIDKYLGKILMLIVISLISWSSVVMLVQNFMCPELTQMQVLFRAHKVVMLDFEKC